MKSADTDTAERDFLLHVARVAVGTASFMPHLLPQVQDWELVFRLASQHAVTPLLCHALSPRIAGEIPAAAMELRRAASRRLLLCSAQMAAALEDLLDLFQTHGISAMPLKGPTLGVQLYGEPSLRSSVDIDILVRPRDLLRARDLVIARGYQPTCPAEPTQQAAYLRVRHELRLVREDAFVIELHQAFLPVLNQFAYDYDALWTRLRPLRFNKRDVLVMPAEDLLLVLCAHGAKHLWARLGWICDLARLLVRFREEISWSRLDELAHELGARRMVLLGLFLAHELLDAWAPETLLNATKNDKTVARLAAQVSGPWCPGSFGDFGKHIFFLRARERFRDRAAYCAHLLFAPTEQDHAACSFPPLLRGLYYPLHTLRFTARCAEALFHLSGA